MDAEQVENRTRRYNADMRFVFLVIFLLSCFVVSPAQWVKQTVNTAAAFRGLSVVNDKVVWASGTGGTVIRTADGGKTWSVIVVPGAEKLDFRDIEAFDANTAYILSIGNGESSRIYKTTDGGKNWKLQFQNKDAKAFFDAIACWDARNCIAMSDPVDGHYPLIATANGGEKWERLATNMPTAKDGEAAFAASGTCLIARGKSVAYLVSGGTDARVFRSSDRGRSWTVADTPIVKGAAGSGIFSIAMRDDRVGIIVGGNYEKPAIATDTLAFTTNGGSSWIAAGGLSGYRSGVAYAGRERIVAVGTNGSDISDNGGQDWRVLDKGNWNVVQAKGASAIWAAGPKGLIARLELK